MRLNFTIYISLFLMLNLAPSFLSGQVLSDSMYKDMGVSISPSTMHLNVKPGESYTRDIRLKNETDQFYEFVVGFQDFEMSTAGKASMSFTPEKDDSEELENKGAKYGLSKHIIVTPNAFSLKPGEEIKLKVVVDIPDEEENYVAKWGIITIDQIYERQPLDPGDQPNRLAMGVIPTFGFGVFVYQNPPNVKINQLDIDAFRFEKTEKGNRVVMSVKNVGDGITYCVSYLELMNLKTGIQQKLQNKTFTILPLHHRIFNYEMPAGLLPGKYSAVGVVDYGHKEEIIAAELEFEIQ